MLNADALREALHFTPQGERAGNVLVGRGELDGRAVHCAFAENRVASGALGVAECTALGALFDAIATRPEPLVLFLDSAGAKVSEGLPALGAFRRLYASGLRCALSGAPMAAVLGTNCFGGASMLAHLARMRLFAPGTRLAMSGPAILAASAGMSATDEAFRAMAEATLSAAARSRASPRNAVADGAGFDLHEWLRRALETLRLRAAVITTTADQAFGLCRELRDDFGMEADAVLADELVASRARARSLARLGQVSRQPSSASGPTWST